MEKNNMTAVEWLAIRYHHRQGYLSLEDITKAKEMEKNQILDAYESYPALAMSADEYYNQRYKNENDK